MNPETISDVHNISDWHKELISQRLADYKSNPEQALDFDSAMDEIEESIIKSLPKKQ
jgi:hypothetical protein